MDHASPIAHLETPNPGLKARLTQAVAWVEFAFRTARERRQLMALDEFALKDIGASKADAYREGSRAFWDLPQQRQGDGRRRIG